jgi:RimJ/RimL family protein N-acetyltransferase
MSKSPRPPILATLPLADGRFVAISKVHEDDAAALVVYADVTAGETDFLTYGPGEFGMTAEAEAAFIRTLDDEQKGFLLKATLEGEIVGIATLARSLRSRIQHVGELGLSVRRPLWRRGIGRSLTTTLLAEARRTGVTRAWLQARDDNERALRLYERQGFLPEGRRVGAMITHGVEHDLLVLAARLDEPARGPGQ